MSGVLPFSFLTRSAVSPACWSSTSAIGHDLDVLLRQERVEELAAAAPRADQARAGCFSLAEPALPIAGAPITEAAPAVIPTVSTNPRRVIPELDMMVNPFPAGDWICES